MDVFYYPVKIEFEKDFQYEDEIYELIKTIPDIRIVKEYFFTELIELLKDENNTLTTIKDFINKYCPFIEHMELCLVKINNTSVDDIVDTIKYNKNTFIKDIYFIINQYKIRLETTIKNNSQFTILNVFTKTPFNLKCLGDAHFYTKNFKVAEFYYKKINKNYTNYIERMIALCNYFEYKSYENILLLDVYLLTNSMNSIYNIKRNCTVKEIRHIINEFLLKQHLPFEKKLLLLYECFSIYLKLKNQSKVDNVFKLFKITINKQLTISSTKYIWINILDRMNNEYNDVFKN